MTEASSTPNAVLGWFGFATGAVALILTLVVFWAGPFAPQQSTGVTVGELAAEIARSAARSAAGQPQPVAEPRPRDIDDYIAIGVGVLAGLAIVFGVGAFVRQERARAAISGIALGGIAISVQFFTYAVMMIVGALVIGAIVYALRDTLGGIFGG